MKKLTEGRILRLIKEDKWMMDILHAAESLNLPDWWLGAGFVRSKVWDSLHGYKTRTSLPDVDLIYFDKKDFLDSEAEEYSTKAEDEYQKRLKKINSSVAWSVTNQARMHLYHKRKPYKNSKEALSEWSETATCIGIKLNKGKLTLLAPYGISDLTNLVLRAIPNYEKLFAFDPDAFNRRRKEKKWLQKWPQLRVIS